jgi:prolyl-tRNA editing enzyme YbaK/EbsC (Cys-tRNA(Pro) deacylase)
VWRSSGNRTSAASDLAQLRGLHSKELVANAGEQKSEKAERKAPEKGSEVSDSSSKKGVEGPGGVTINTIPRHSHDEKKNAHATGQKHPREPQTPKKDHKKPRSLSFDESESTPLERLEESQNAVAAKLDQLEQRLWQHLAHRQEKVSANLASLEDLLHCLSSLVVKGEIPDLDLGVAGDDDHRKRQEHAEHSSPDASKRRKSAGLLVPEVPPGGLSETHQRVLGLARSLHLSDVFAVAPDDYYSWELEERRALLGAASIHHLVKTIVMTNTKAGHDDISDPLFSKHYMVIVQYTAKLCNESIQKRLRELNVQKKGISPPKKNWNFRLCDPEESAKLTGFGFNAVCPLGSATKLPIILSHKIAELGKEAYVWFGGGEVNLKWRVSVAEFINHFDPIVADITYN